VGGAQNVGLCGDSVRDPEPDGRNRAARRDGLGSTYLAKQYSAELVGCIIIQTEVRVFIQHFQGKAEYGYSVRLQVCIHYDTSLTLSSQKNVEFVGMLSFPAFKLIVCNVLQCTGCSCFFSVM
jgi:hypothetical protein